MARPLRIQSAGLTYHVTSRGNAKMAIYRDEDDRDFFLTLLGDVSEEHCLRVHTYCEMTNHYHLVFRTDKPNLSKAMKTLNGEYVRYFNRRHRRCGHLFQGRFNAQVIEDEGYLRTVCRYVALNPVRAGLAAAPELWKWSAHRALGGIDRQPPFLSAEFLQSEFLESDLRLARLRYLDFVHAPTDEDGALAGVLERDTRVVGSATFVTKFAERLMAASREVPRRERFLARPSLHALLDGTPARARLNARMLEAHDAYGYTLDEIASFIGVSRPCVSARVAEARRSSTQT